MQTIRLYDVGLIEVSRVILLLFEMVSGLQINLEKSSLFTVNGAQNLTRLGNILGCQTGNPENILKCHWGLSSRRNMCGKRLKRDAKRRLAMWKRQYLSLGCRVVQINSVLDSQPTFYVLVFFNSQYEKTIDRVGRNFLWGWL